MSRTLLDDDFNDWEVFANPGRFGLSGDAYIVFRCASDPGERARSVALDGDKSDAEATVVRLSDAELMALLKEAEALD